MSELEDVLAYEKWHKPYAAALIEVDPTRSRPPIVLAERAIIARYMELCISRGSECEYRDLWRAVMCCENGRESTAVSCSSSGRVISSRDETLNSCAPLKTNAFSSPRRTEASMENSGLNPMKPALYIVATGCQACDSPRQ
jgi:hypothetical protein